MNSFGNGNLDLFDVARR